MSDIREFIEARLAEDEAVARKAAGLVGVGAEARYYTGWSYDREQFRVTTDGTSWINAKDTGDACGEHMARHDPARVLREIAAKRRIVAENPPLPTYSEAEQHRYCIHPEYEYATTEGQRKAWDDADTPPEGEGWERNTDKGRDGWERYDYTEESYWRRRLPDDKFRTAMIAPPRELRILAAIWSDHADYDPAWRLED